PPLLLFASVRPLLHSFPTRRSSDLCYTSFTPSPTVTHMCEALGFSYIDRNKIILAPLLNAITLRGPSPQIITDPEQVRALLDGRSEEHTSELQSPDPLVCRLLLEKT